MSVNKDEQIKALLNGRAYEFACEKLGVRNMETAYYSDIFTVSRAEIDAWVAKNGVPKNMYNRAEFGTLEGINLGKSDDKWYLFRLERGKEHDEQIFDNVDDARKTLVDWILNLNSTGIDFSR